MNYIRTCVTLQRRTIRYAAVPLPLLSRSAPHTSLQAQPQAAAGTCHYKFLSGRHSRPTINLQRQASVKAQGLLSAQPPSGPVPPFILVWLRPNPSGMRPKSVPKTSQKCPKSVPRVSQKRPNYAYSYLIAHFMKPSATVSGSPSCHAVFRYFVATAWGPCQTSCCLRYRNSPVRLALTGIAEGHSAAPGSLHCTPVSTPRAKPPLRTADLRSMA